MKWKLLAAPLLALVPALAVLAVGQHPRKAPEPVAEQWVPPAVVATASATVEAAPPPPPPAPVVKAPADVRPGSVSSRSPRVVTVSPRRCPPGLTKEDEVPMRDGRCPRVRDTPLVLSFDGAPVEYLADRAHAFDINGAASQVTDWPTARTPWLALDRDGDGRIVDGSELFGSMTVLSSGDRAPNGFAALRELDADGDGRITPADPGFARLLIWTDRDGDRSSSPDELAPASAYELLSIDLDDTVDPRCDARGNCEVERATFRYRDPAGVVRTGAVIDVHLPAQR